MAPQVVDGSHAHALTGWDRFSGTHLSHTMAGWISPATTSQAMPSGRKETQVPHRRSFRAGR